MVTTASAAAMSWKLSACDITRHVVVARACSTACCSAGMNGPVTMTACSSGTSARSRSTAPCAASSTGYPSLPLPTVATINGPWVGKPSSWLRQELGLPTQGPLIVATVGSGSDGYPVLEAAQGAVERLRAEVPELHAVMVTGPFMPAEQQAVLQARATTTCRVMSQADNFQLMAAADAVVTMGGYNSVCEALAVARPLVIVPRATHKVEQQIRAETLAARGLARWVHPRDVAGPRLLEALRWAVRCDRRAHAERVREVIPSFDGAARLVSYLAGWLGGD